MSIPLSSYVRRAQLIKSVFFFNVDILAHIIILPKKIKKICKDIWRLEKLNFYEATSGMGKSLSTSISCSLNIINIMIWNRAAICKLLCNICKKKENLEVKWMYIYYGKGRTIWQIEPKQAAWVTRKILKSTKYNFFLIR